MFLIFYWFNWQILSFRESNSDDSRFYMFTATETLHLRTHSKRDRDDWIQALVTTRNLFLLRSLNDNLSLLPNDLSLKTERLKKRLLEEGINENLAKDCEKIMLSEFSELQGQLKVLCEERSNLLDTLRQLEVKCWSTWMCYLCWELSFWKLWSSICYMKWIMFFLFSIIFLGVNIMIPVYVKTDSIVGVVILIYLFVMCKWTKLTLVI